MLWCAQNVLTLPRYFVEFGVGDGFSSDRSGPAEFSCDTTEYLERGFDILFQCA